MKNGGGAGGEIEWKNVGRCLAWAWEGRPLVRVHDHYQPWAGADPGVSPIHSCLPVWVLPPLYTIHSAVRALGDPTFSKGVVICEISHQVLGALGTISHVLKAWVRQRCLPTHKDLILLQDFGSSPDVNAERGQVRREVVVSVSSSLVKQPSFKAAECGSLMTGPY